MARSWNIAFAIAIAFAAAGAGQTPSLRGAMPITAEAVLAELNRVREDAGLDPLRDDFRLRLAAEDRMLDMVELAYWSHESPNGHSPFVWVRLRGYRHSRLGENLAAGFETAGVLVESWMESKGHRANILEAGFHDAGIAVLDGSTTQRASGKSVVVIFGRETIAAPISRRGSTDQSRPPSGSDHR